MNSYKIINHQLNGTIILAIAIALSAIFLIGIQTTLATPTPTPTPCECTNPLTETYVSDLATIVVGDTPAAVAISPAWTALISGSTWIWKSSATTPNEVVVFEKNFTIVGTVLLAELNIATDNSYQAFIDNVLVAQDANANNFQIATQDTHNLTSAVTPGIHTLRIEVKNIGTFNADTNQAGLLYKFEIKTCPPKCCGIDIDGNLIVKNENSAYVKNYIDTTAKTGGNNANGGSGGNGGDGGNIKNSGDDIKNTSTGNGGSGGNGGYAYIQTGNAKARTKIINIINKNIIRIR